MSENNKCYRVEIESSDEVVCLEKSLRVNNCVYKDYDTLTVYLPLLTNLFFSITVGRDRGAGARGNRGREGYGRREEKEREARVLRGREAGEKCETIVCLFFFFFN